MKKLFPGLTQAVVIRQPARHRTKKHGFDGLPFFPNPGIDPVEIQLFWVINSGEFRLYTYRPPLTSAQIDLAVLRLGRFDTTPPIGGWLFNEQVQQFLVSVEPE